MNEYQEKLLERILDELQAIKIHMIYDKMNEHKNTQNISNKMEDIEKENEEILKTW